MTKPKYKIGDWLRYSDGPTAWMQVTDISESHGGPGKHRYYGDHIYGGTIGVYEYDVSEPVPSTAIVSLTYYQCAKLLEYADRRAAVFDANAPGTASALMGEVPLIEGDK